MDVRYPTIDELLNKQLYTIKDQVPIEEAKLGPYLIELHMIEFILPLQYSGKIIQKYADKVVFKNLDTNTDAHLATELFYDDKDPRKSQKYKGTTYKIFRYQKNIDEYANMIQSENPNTNSTKQKVIGNPDLVRQIGDFLGGKKKTNTKLRKTKKGRHYKKTMKKRR